MTVTDLTSHGTVIRLGVRTVTGPSPGPIVTEALTVAEAGMAARGSHGHGTRLPAAAAAASEPEPPDPGDARWAALARHQVSTAAPPAPGRGGARAAVH